MYTGSIARWLYRGGHPDWIARVLNRVSATLHAVGIAPDYLVTLEVRGRHSGRAFSFPLVMVRLDGERYLVSMLGNDASWVKNVAAAGGHAVLRHGRQEDVTLEPVPIDRRGPILKAYTRCAPGSRPHLQIPIDAPVPAFDAIAPRFPVFRVVVRPGAGAIDQPSPGAPPAAHEA